MKPKQATRRTELPSRNAPGDPRGGNPQRPAQDQRWQRTVRFNWDKGGSKGGRK